MMNLAHVLDGKPGDAPALVSRGEVTTYGQLAEQAGRLRGGLGRLGVQPGDRVAVLAANNWYFVVGYLAALGVGAAVVPLNPTSPPAELQRELAAVGARVAIAGPSARDAMTRLQQGEDRLETVILAGEADFPGAVNLDEVMRGAATPVVERDDGDIAVMIFTAGTAGAPKPAMLSHGSLRTNLEQVRSHPGRRLDPADVLFGVLPLFHIFGLNVMLNLALWAGASVVLVERFEPDAALETIQARGVTIVGGAPAMFAALATIPGVRGDELRGVRLAISGAAPLTEEVAAAFAGRFGQPLWQGYGLTEAGPVVTSSIVGGDVRPTSIGVPLPGLEVRLVDVDGEDALEGDPGEIWVRGPNVFGGYWGDEEATARALSPDGWLRTGDLAVADADGYLYLVDRVKDVIIVSGFNVFPAEVEDALRAHPAVADAAVVGRPHPYSGETVAAYVVVHPGAAVEEDELIAWAAHRLARYKCPTKVTFVPELPRSVAGKVLRRTLS